MKSKFYSSLILILIVTVFYSCSNNGEVMYKNITGKANELVIVISNQYWEGAPGNLIRETLGQPQASLPQSEPIFDLINVPKEGFKRIFQSTRNIVQVTISSTVETPEVTYEDDVWAYPQATLKIKVKNAMQFEETFTKNQDKIMSYFLAAEKERLTMNYNKYFEKGVYNVLSKDYGVTMKVPPGFVIALQTKELIWYKYETPDISQGIILYTSPYVSDSTFTCNYLVSLRDSILKANVPGSVKGSYMTTEKRFDQIYNIFEHNKNYASEMRGLWTVENDFMGGPYISLSELDASNQRVVSAFGYVYAPSKEKRNFLRQVEAMVYSLELNDQAKNDKINSQVKMGN